MNLSGKNSIPSGAIMSLMSWPLRFMRDRSGGTHSTDPGHRAECMRCTLSAPVKRLTALPRERMLVLSMLSCLKAHEDASLKSFFLEVRITYLFFLYPPPPLRARFELIEKSSRRRASNPSSLSSSFSPVSGMGELIITTFAEVPGEGSRPFSISSYLSSTPSLSSFDRGS